MTGTDLQLSLFDHIDTSLVLKPTPALLRGDSEAVQCVTCGLVACITGMRRRTLGPCPACNNIRWSRQSKPISIFAGEPTDG
jgi:hypothetical protein